MARTKLNPSAWLARYAAAVLGPYVSKGGGAGDGSVLPPPPNSQFVLPLGYFFATISWGFGYIFYLPLFLAGTPTTLAVFVACSKLMAWVRSHQAGDKTAADARAEALTKAREVRKFALEDPEAYAKELGVEPSSSELARTCCAWCAYSCKWWTGLVRPWTLRGQLREVLWWFDPGDGELARQDLTMAFIMLPVTWMWYLVWESKVESEKRRQERGAGFSDRQCYLGVLTCGVGAPLVLITTCFNLVLTNRALDTDPERALATFYNLNDVMKLTMATFLALTISPFLMGAVLTAFYAYSGPSNHDFNEFVADYYRHTFAIMRGVPFTLPSFEFDPTVMFTLSFYEDLFERERGRTIALALPHSPTH